MLDKVDLDGVPLYVGDTVLVARPLGYKGSGACLARALIIRFTNTGVTVQCLTKEGLNIGAQFNTPFRSNKFMKVAND